MKIAICDDEPAVGILISEIIQKKFQSLDLVIRLFTTGEELTATLEKTSKNFDLIFLDIEMPGLSGIDIAKELKRCKEDTKFAFVTSHDEYALAGYEVSAFRFIKKPIEETKILEVITALMEEKKLQRKITLEFNGVTSVIPLKDIIYVEAQRQNVKVVTANNIFCERLTLTEFQKRLNDDTFYSSHRSYLVNLAFVVGIGTDVYLANGEKIPLSRMRRKNFKIALTQYVHKVVS